MSQPSNGITPEVIRSVMPPYQLNPDLLQATLAVLPRHPQDATTAWRQARIARLTQEISTLMPANAAQARFAAQVVISIEMADTLRNRAHAPDVDLPLACQAARTAATLMQTAVMLKRSLTQDQQKPAPFFGTVLSDAVDIPALDAISRLTPDQHPHPVPSAEAPPMQRPPAPPSPRPTNPPHRHQTSRRPSPNLPSPNPPTPSLPSPSLPTPSRIIRRSRMPPPHRTTPPRFRGIDPMNPETGKNPNSPFPGINPMNPEPGAVPGPNPRTKPPVTTLTPTKAQALRSTTLANPHRDLAHENLRAQLAAKFGPPPPPPGWRIPHAVPQTGSAMTAPTSTHNPRNQT